MCVVLLAVFGCGDDDEGKVVGGTGYELTVPDGWDDRSEEGEDVEVEGFTPDVLLIGEREDDFTSNVNVILTPDAGRGLNAQARAERDALESRQIPNSTSSAQELTPTERITLGDKAARAYEFKVEQDDRLVRIRQVLAQHNGSNYAVTLTAAGSRFDDDRDAFESMLESWSWR
jgi:hypothetical protein